MEVDEGDEGGEGLSENAAMDRATSGSGADVPYRSQMERVFGHTFGGARAYVGQAGALGALNAEAATRGEEVAFASLVPSPAVVAHELARVKQYQRDGGESGKGLPVLAHESGDSPAEREAEAVAPHVEEHGLGGPLPTITARVDAQIHRSPCSHAGGESASADGAGASSPSSGVTAAEAIAGVTAERWLELHAQTLVARLPARIEASRFLLPVPEARWSGDGERGFAMRLVEGLGGAGHLLWNQLGRLLRPLSPRVVVDVGRECYPAERGTAEWKPQVTVEVGTALVERAIESLRRMLPRWIELQNQQALRAEAGQAPAAAVDESALPGISFLLPASRSSLLPTSHPMDAAVIAALSGNFEVDLAAYRKRHPGERKIHEIREQLRPVAVEFLAEYGAPSWVRVVGPADATAEEVSFELYGTSERAAELTASGRFFGFGRQGREETFVPAQESRYQAALERARRGPGGGAGAMAADRASQLLAVPQLGEEAAIQSAGGLERTSGLSPDAVRQRLVLVVNRIQEIKGPAAQLVVEAARREQYVIDSGGIHAEKSPAVEEIEARLEGARKRVLDRLVGLGKRNDTVEIARWEQQSSGQLQIANAAWNGITTAVAVARQYEEMPGAFDLVRDIGEAYVSAVEVSDLYEEGKRRLDRADQKTRLFPAALAEVVLAQLRRVIERVRMSRSDPSRENSAHGVKRLEGREQVLRERVAALRAALLQDPKSARRQVARLQEELADVEAGVQIVANMDDIDAAWRRLRESLSIAGEARGLFGHAGNDVRRDAMRDVLAMESQWFEVYLLWQSDRRAGQEALARKSRSAEWRRFLERIRSVLTEQAQYDALVTFGAMIGIALVTGGLGVYAGAAAGAAWGTTAGLAVTATTDTAAFTTMSYFLVDNNPSVRGFLAHLGENALMFGGLSAASHGYRALVGAGRAATLEGRVGRLATEFAALNATALASANAESVAARGRSLGQEEIVSISLSSAAFVAALNLGGKLVEPWSRQLALTGELHGSQRRVERARADLASTLEAVGASKGRDTQARDNLVPQEAELLGAEKELLDRLERAVGEIDRMPEAERAGAFRRRGITPDLAETVRTGKRTVELADDREALALAEAHADLESAGGGDFLVAPASFDTLVRRFKQRGARVVDGPGAARIVQLAGTRMVQVVPRDGTAFRLIERAGPRRVNVIDFASAHQPEAQHSAPAQAEASGAADRDLANASPEEKEILQSVLALDATDGRRLIREYGEELTDHLRSNPLTTLADLERSLARRRAEVKERVRGLAEGIDINKPPDGWTFDTVGPRTDVDGVTRVVRTKVYGPNGAEGFFVRAYNPASKELELRMAFLKESGKDKALPNMVEKQQHGPEMIPGKGTPTVQYVTLYQMKLLGVPLGGAAEHGVPGVERIHMSDIQNVETIVHLHWLRKSRGGAPSDLIQFTASVKYAETTAVQSGYQMYGRPLVTGGQETSIRGLLSFQERGNPQRIAENDAILAKYGFDRDALMLWGFDIDLTVREGQ